MYTIEDYIKYYKNLSLDDVKWNVADNLICSLLVYVPIKGFKNKMKLQEFYNYYLKNKDNYSENYLIKKSQELLKQLVGSKRYQNMYISNFVNIRNNEVQFGACTFRIADLTIIAYKGTDTSLIGWIENFRLMYSYPTYTHTLALDYLKNNIKLFKDINVFIVGHSKGGNLACSVGLEASNYIFNKIVNIINFDGPGFRYDEYKSNKYQRLKTKLINIIPTGSIVGSILEQDNYQVVKSNDIAWNQHYPTSWLMFGQFFIEGNLSKVSQNLHEKTTINLRNMDKTILKETFESLYQSIDKDYASDVVFKFDELRKTYKKLKNIEPQAKKQLDEVMLALFKAFSSKK